MSGLYDERLCDRLLLGHEGAWRYVRRRWPGLKKMRVQGYHGVVCSLPKHRVIKFTNNFEEIDNAVRVKKEKPAGVVPVLSFGAWHYIMPKLVEGTPGAEPVTGSVYHIDISPHSPLDKGRNIMLDPKSGEHVFIDLDGLCWT